MHSLSACQLGTCNCIVGTIDMAQGDTAPLAVVTLKDATDTAIDLTGCTVTVDIKRGETFIIEGGAVVIDSVANGQVHFADWQSVINANASLFNTMSGLYQMRFHVVLSTGKRISVPNHGFIGLCVSA